MVPGLLRGFRWALLVVAVPTNSIAQEPWLQFGDHDWGVRDLQSLIHLQGISYDNQLQVWYPATVEGTDVPASTEGAPYPVIFFQHAAGSDYSFYDYQFSRLASHGFIVISIRHDHTTCPTWWDCHRELFEENIRLIFETWNVSPAHFLFRRLDSKRIGLAGHSHGAAFLAMRDYRPMDPTGEYEIDSVCLIAPCPDIAIAEYEDTYAGMPPLQVIYGSKDECGCTGNGQGIATYDPASRPRHHVYVIGANHWAFCEGGSLAASTIPRMDAWRASAASMVAWHRYVHYEDESALPFLRGEEPLTIGAPEVRYQFQDVDPLVVDDFGDAATVLQPGVAIAGVPDQTFINGFLGDTFVDFAAGTELMLQQITALVGSVPGCAEVLFFRDGTLGPDVYDAALNELELAGTVCTPTFTSNFTQFAAMIPSADWDLIVCLNQTGSSSASRPFDAPLATYICAGGKAIISDFRVLSTSASATLSCSDSGYDGLTNWSTFSPVPGSPFSGQFELQNPGWGIWTMGLLADDSATVFATNETLTTSVVANPTVNALGFDVVATGFGVFDETHLLSPGETLYHPTAGLEVRWSVPGAQFTQFLADPAGTEGLNVTGRRNLAFRVLQIYGDPLNPPGAPKDFHVRMEDAAGETATLLMSSAPQGPLRAPVAPDPAVGWKSIFESYRLRLSEFQAANPALDLSRLRSITFVFDVSPTGRCYFDDIEFDGDASAFVRGDCNSDAGVDLADAVFVLQSLFSGADPDCSNACDANDSDSVDIADAVFLLNFLFQSSAPPAPPHPRCGPDPDPTAGPGCAQPGACP